MEERGREERGKRRKMRKIDDVLSFTVAKAGGSLMSGCCFGSTCSTFKKCSHGFSSVGTAQPIEEKYF
jgi:hypothetical protein